MALKLGFAKKILHAIGNFLQSEFKRAHESAKIAVKVVAMIKSAIESPVAGVIVDLTPFDFDNKLRDLVMKYTHDVSKGILVAEGVIGTTNTADAILTLVHFLQTKTSTARAKFYVDLAARLTDALSDGELSHAEAVAISQVVFEELFGKEEEQQEPVLEAELTGDGPGDQQL